MKVRLILSLALLLICTGASAALAQGTPDWMTPSEETICDGESGAAYGLCNAYCEAMDCDSDDAQASATACTKVRDKFTNITGRDLPCEAPPTCPPPPPGTTCPCVGNSFFDAGLNNPGTCESSGTAAAKRVANDLSIYGVCDSPTPNGGYCAAFLGPVPVLLQDITPEEGSACYYQILDSCNPE